MEHTRTGGMAKGLSFKAKINLTLITVFTLLLISSAVSKYSSQSDQLQNLLETNTAANTEVFQAQINSDAEGLARALSGLTRIESLLSPWVAGDRAKLLEAAAPIFAELKAKNNITHMYFFDTNGVTFLRAHNPKQFGDQNKRNSFKLARNGNGLGVSLDMGKNYFSLRAVVPVNYQGQHIGYMEAAQEIDHIFGRTMKITGFQPTVLLSKDYQDRLGTTIKGASVGNFNLLESTDGQAALELVDAMGLGAGASASSSADQKFTGFVGDYFVGASPLMDGSGQVAGVLMFHKNVSTMKSAMVGKVIMSILLQSLFIIAGLIVVAMVIRSTLRILGGDPAYAREMTKIIASGDLEQDIATEKGDTSSLLAAMKQMRDQLRDAVAGINEVSVNIAGAAQEIAAGNTSLSQRTEEQASSLEETASSMEEMTGTVKQNADSASEAKQLADANSQRATSGANVVNRTIEAMGEINESSARIADIIGTIDGIAFQTNLLALNAAVEAARAGEQGRGFAVVASEVRSLAQRSAEAAKEIKALIEDSVGKVKVGTELVDESGKTLEEIITGTQKVADIIAEIAAASNEQASGIDQVNNAITQMDNMTQDNAALVEEAAASSREMQDRAGQLRELMSYFRIKSDSRIEASSSTHRLGQNSENAKQAPRTTLTASRAERTRPATNDTSEWEQF